MSITPPKSVRKIISLKRSRENLQSNPEDKQNVLSEMDITADTLGARGNIVSAVYPVDYFHHANL